MFSECEWQVSIDHQRVDIELNLDIFPESQLTITYTYNRLEQAANRAIEKAKQQKLKEQAAEVQDEL